MLSHSRWLWHGDISVQLLLAVAIGKTISCCIGQAVFATD
jgi:hypothetical protein